MSSVLDLIGGTDVCVCVCVCNVLRCMWRDYLYLEIMSKSFCQSLHRHNNCSGKSKLSLTRQSGLTVNILYYDNNTSLLYFILHCLTS